MAQYPANDQTLYLDQSSVQSPYDVSPYPSSHRYDTQNLIPGNGYTLPIINQAASTFQFQLQPDNQNVFEQQAYNSNGPQQTANSYYPNTITPCYPPNDITIAVQADLQSNSSADHNSMTLQSRWPQPDQRAYATSLYDWSWPSSMAPMSSVKCEELPTNMITSSTRFPETVNHSSSSQTSTIRKPCIEPTVHHGLGGCETMPRVTRELSFSQHKDSAGAWGINPLYHNPEQYYNTMPLYFSTHSPTDTSSISPSTTSSNSNTFTDYDYVPESSPCEQAIKVKSKIDRKQKRHQGVDILGPVPSGITKPFKPLSDHNHHTILSPKSFPTKRPKFSTRKANSQLSPDEKEARDNLLIQLRMEGVKYKDICAMHMFPESESTLRGRVRILTGGEVTKKRMPDWSADDVRILPTTYLLPQD